MPKKSFILIATVVFFAFCLVQPLSAQDYQRGQQQQQQGYEQQGTPPEAQPEITEAQLEKAAVASVKVEEIGQEFQQKVQDAQTPEERVRLQNDANEKRIQAVRDAGIQIATYNQVMTQLNQDEDLRQKFVEKREEVE